MNISKFNLTNSHVCLMYSTGNSIIVLDPLNYLGNISGMLWNKKGPRRGKRKRVNKRMTEGKSKEKVLGSGREAIAKSSNQIPPLMHFAIPTKKTTPTKQTANHIEILD
ncbi:hypothetical protein TNCT_292151 [Trichonephila clavata]|uniref:Uncharacterized protein n=1 Tax=Trichonephila clavata TaxID=2740835 RepID=A0A8X6HKQ8_TRICU|nr:hypothetical protein TNCT_292151 [Trichonephila clavata]